MEREASLQVVAQSEMRAEREANQPRGKNGSKSPVGGAWRGREEPVRAAEAEGGRESGGRRRKRWTEARPWGTEGEKGM